MNKALSRLKDLSQRAAELKAAIQQVPPKVMEVRETLASTTGQLLQLKADFRQSLAGLRIETETGLSEAMHEINASAEIFAEAGYLISGVDLELSPAQRILVRLAKADTVPLGEISSLAAANRHRRTTQAILSALLQAEQMAATIKVTGLEYCDLVVGVGMMPSARMGWREAGSSPAALFAALRPAVVPAPTPSPALPTPSMFGAGSFFEQRTLAPTASSSSPTREATPAAAATAAHGAIQLSARPDYAHSAAPAPAPTDSADPLARFKRMPGCSKYKP
jgi:hypothetical protein